MVICTVIKKGNTLQHGIERTHNFMVFHLFFSFFEKVNMEYLIASVKISWRDLLLRDECLSLTKPSLEKNYR